eukprot:1274220-Pyramimonas_sp.AAC.1
METRHRFFRSGLGGRWGAYFWCLLGATWEPLESLLGLPWGFLGMSAGPFWDLLGTCWGILGASWKPLEAEGSKYPFGLPVWAIS